MKILITGAAGNLGALLAEHMLPGEHELNLLIHHTELPYDPGDNPRGLVFRADLAEPQTLYPACRGSGWLPMWPTPAG